MKIQIEIDITPQEFKELGYVTVQDVLEKVYQEVVKQNPILRANAAIVDKIFKQRTQGET
jgi:isopentenyldiphosphate isomerase